MKTWFRSWLRILITLLGIGLLIYLLVPAPRFPTQIPGSYRSNEPADVEDSLRQGFYTDWDRAQIMDYFGKQFSKSSWMGLPLPTERLNYPPEEGQSIIRDQTRSRYLEEFVHPLRESIFVNGFFALKDTEVMIVEGHEYKTKVVVKMVPSNPLVRLVISLAALFFGYITVMNLLRATKEIKNA